MTLLDEIKVRNQIIEGEIWISLKDIAEHVLGSAKDFIKESSQISIVYPVTPIEAAYIEGVAQGMSTVAALLAQGGMEAQFHEKVNTVEDLLNAMEDRESD